jgi:hypothetical protein
MSERLKSWINRARPALTQARTMVWIVVALFVGAATAWFVIVAATDGGIDAGQAFLGLGYMSAVVIVVLMALLAVRLLGNGAAQSRPSEGDAKPDAQRTRENEQAIVKWQICIGAFLIAFGAVLAVVFGVLLEDGTNGISLAIGTAVIGAGAALLPPGAAAGAGERARQVKEAERGKGGPPGSNLS